MQVERKFNIIKLGHGLLFLDYTDFLVSFVSLLLLERQREQRTVFLLIIDTQVADPWSKMLVTGRVSCFRILGVLKYLHIHKEIPSEWDPSLTYIAWRLCVCVSLVPERFIYLKERALICCFTPNQCRGTRNLSPSPVWWKGPSTWAVTFFCPQVCISRKLWLGVEPGREPRFSWFGMQESQEAS